MGSISEVIAKSSDIYVKQKKSWGEILVNFEAKNRYEIFDLDRRVIGTIKETGSRLKQILSRLFLRSHRGFCLVVKNVDETPYLILKRKFFFFFSDLYVFNDKDLAIGSIHRRFGILSRRYDLRDMSGNTFANIKSPIFRLWSFPISIDTTPVAGAGIFKKWSGALREFFTDADSFAIKFGIHPWRLDQKLIIFACAVSIDFDFFEDNQANR